MRYIFIFFLVGFLCSCNDRHYIKKKVDDYWIEANYINDSTIDGVAKTFNSEERLISLNTYNQGVKNGISINFHSNGKVYDSINFFNGLENGSHYVYDSSGTLGYMDFYLYGHQLGPEVFYKNGIVSSYLFSSFEKFEIFKASYNSIGGLTTYKGNTINASIYHTNLNGNSALGIFSYFVHPPDFNIIYKLILRDSLTKNETEIRKFENEIFIDTIVKQPYIHSIYCIKAILKDSSNKPKKIFYEELIH